MATGLDPRGSLGLHCLPHRYGYANVMKSTASTHLAERSERTTTETTEEALGALHAEDNKKKIEST